MELGHWVTGSMGHLSRQGHRVIILTRCETRVLTVFEKMPKMQNVHLKCWNDKIHCQVSVIGLKSLDVSPCNELLFNFIHRKNFDSSINKEKIQKQKDTRNQHTETRTQAAQVVAWRTSNNKLVYYADWQTLDNILSNKFHLNRNLFVRCPTSILTVGRSKCDIQLLIIPLSSVRNSLIIMRFTVNSKERMSETRTGHTSSPYNSTGKHFALIKYSTTSSFAFTFTYDY